MQRYFVGKPYHDGEWVSISGEDHHHIVRVMRMQEGSELFVVFPDQSSAIGKIERISSDAIDVSIVEWESDKKEMPISVTIASGLPKGDKLEWILQKGTELGASGFIPFKAERSIVKWDEKKGKKKVERWEKIVKEAAEQSHRTLIPDLSSPLTLKELLVKADGYDYKLVAYEEESRAGERSNLSNVLSEVKPSQRVLILFGPEGGLTDSEVEVCKENGFIPCGLGPRILRTETAPLYALSAISYQLELMR
ncbi:16S rRNA (uracil(1498)-N(3))-methyltransferase [Rossellomorea marisflavi]|uniref:16S rRNA (uracil(1498)-N(3))-methyltransferase n=1 Tax=Rossellomorea marisflavi TaxID=189381 RepID=UPI00345A2324